MKKIYTLVSFIFLINTTFSQVAIEWEKSFGGSNWDSPNSIEKSSDGFILAGKSYSNDLDVSGNHGSADIWLVKIDSLGNIIWQKTYGGSGDDACNKVKRTQNDGYIIAGVSPSSDGDLTNNYGLVDYWIIKITSTGNIEWQKNYGGSNIDWAANLIITSDNKYLLLGGSFSNDNDVSNNYGDADAWVVKVDSSGNIEWEKNFGGSGYDVLSSGIELQNKEFVLTGHTSSIDFDIINNYGNNDLWCLKIDSAGNILWNKTYGGSDNDGTSSIVQTPDGGFLLSGASSSNDNFVNGNNGNSDYWIIKLDSSGNFMWQKCFGGSDIENSSALKSSPNGGYLLSGYTLSNDGYVTNNHGQADYWLVKIDQNGNLEWQKTLGGTDNDWGTVDVIFDDFGNFLVLGHSWSSDGDVSINLGGIDYWLVKLNLPTEIKLIENQFNLSLYPNPATSEINISFNLDKTSHVNLQLYNSLGQLVKTITNEKLNAGENKINFSTGNIPPGIYHLNFSVDGNVVARKVVKM